MKSCCEEHHDHDHDHEVDRATLVRIGLVGVAVVAVWLGGPQMDVLALAGTVLGGWPVFRHAAQALLRRQMTMELSMTLALVAALLIGESFTALLIVFFVLIAEAIEGLTMERGERAIHDLLDLLPDRVTVRRDGQDREVDLSEVRVGETVVVRPGERVPVDGQVLAGHSFVEEAVVTGEPVPAEKTAGAWLLAGSMNGHGVLEARVDRVGEETAFGRIVDAVEHAEHSRAPVQRLADRLAGGLVLFALLCAVATWFLTRDLRATISVILVAGACGVAAGTPLALLGALGRAARLGVIVKGGQHLETLGVVDTVVLDKTGTLTTAQPVVAALRTAPGVTEEELLRAAAVAEARSEHPLARAVLECARERGVLVEAPETFAYTPGLGIVCQAGGEEIRVGSRALVEVPWAAGAATEIAVARAGRFLGTLEVEDPLRSEAAQAMADLRTLGVRVQVLTGDSPAVAQEIGRRLGVEAVGGLLPHQKQARVEELVRQGRKVAMVGDGINDAPALAAADVGVAMGSGTDLARESADAVLLGNDLDRLVRTLEVARRCRAIILFNFVGTLVVDLAGIGLAAAGLLTPVLAVLIHVGSELAFILNSARLLPAPERRKESASPLPEAVGSKAA